MGSDLACSVYVKKVAKWYVDTNRFLFSYDPHELASWVKKIVNLTGCAGDFTLGRQHLTEPLHRHTYSDTLNRTAFIG